jgi:glutaredoxin
VLNGCLLAAGLAPLGVLALWWMQPELFARRPAVSESPLLVAEPRPVRQSEPAGATGEQAQEPLPGAPLTLQPAGAKPDRSAEQAEREDERERDRERSAMVAAQIRERELRAARSGVAVVMYTTAWCGVCKRARAFLGREQIAYVEQDIAHDASAERQLRTLNPRGGVPTFDIEGQVLVGFSESRVLAAVERAAKAR